MSGPYIEMIAASLRKCSLEARGRREVLSPPAEEEEEEEEKKEEVTVELNSEVALPYQWEQCLDMKTGKVYFINWSNGTRTTEDPRFSGYNPEEDLYSESCDEDDSSSSIDNGAINNDYFSTDDTTTTTTANSSSVSYSPGEVTSTSSEPPVLVAAGCRSCFMYFMVLKLDFTCPKCGGHLLHLRPNGHCS